jgi:hypothetical protein
VYDSRRSRGRRFDQQQPPTVRALAPRLERLPSSRLADFHVQLSGEGTICILEYTPEFDEHGRIDFECLVAGLLRITVADKIVLEAKTCRGNAFVAGLFFPAGARVSVTFANLYNPQEYGSRRASVTGKVSIAPAPVPETLDAARALFGLRRHFTEHELTQAYRRLVLRWHPDRPGGSNEELKKINFYYEKLKARQAG